ncbi:MAG: GNAT family N-acetyltransferase [Pseudomonadota bacterium]
MMAVRSATPEDLPFATRMMGQLWDAHGDTYDDAQITDRTAEVMEICDCYVLGDPPVAFASLQDLGDYMLIRHFALENAERGKGKGRAAFEALEAHAFPGRPSRLFASTTLPQPKAFWEKMGYGAFAYCMSRKGRAS